MIALRLTAQLLAGEPARDPVAVAQRLLAIQGQDPRGARLAIRARTTGLSAIDVDRALGEQRTLLITWLNRGTLHLVRSEDYPWLHALTAPGLLTANARRLAQEGLTPATSERGVAVIERSLAEHGPLTRLALPALTSRSAPSPATPSSPRGHRAAHSRTANGNANTNGNGNTDQMHLSARAASQPAHTPLTSRPPRATVPAPGPQSPPQPPACNPAPAPTAYKTSPHAVLKSGTQHGNAPNIRATT
jgi:Winged helix DNA-binding domain